MAVGGRVRIALVGVLLLSWGVAWGAPEVVRMVTAEGVAKKQPRGASTAFAGDGGKAVAWAQLRNDGPATTVTWVWRQDGVEAYRKTSKVAAHAARWRIWTRRWLHPKHAGQWRVTLESASGAVLQEVHFSVGAAEGAPAVGPEPTPAVEPSDAGVCRAWINLRRHDGRLAVLEATLSEPRAPTHVTKGLVVLDDRTVYALRQVARHNAQRGPRGMVKHRWDTLFGQRVPDGEVRPWAGRRARMPPPLAVPRPGRPAHEVNLIEVHSVIGPYVGLHQGITGDTSTGANGFDNSRYRTVMAPGVVADPTILAGEELLPRAMMRAKALRRSEGPDAPDPVQHDFRRSALVAGPDGVALRTLMQCCTWAENRGQLMVDVPVHPPEAVMARLPDALGWWRALNGCGQVRLVDGVLEGALMGQAPRRLKLEGSQASVVLGVAWPPGDLPVRFRDVDRVSHHLPLKK
jgi:hypothetical protein